MKKRILTVLLCLATVMLFMLGVSAADDVDSKRVFDDKGYLSDNEAEKLQEHIKRIQDEYQFDVVIRIAEIADLPSMSLEAFTDDYYDTNINGKYKFGKDGLLIFLNMYEDDDGRDYWLNGCGEHGAVWFDNYFINYVGKKTSFTSRLGNGRYYEALDEVLDLTEVFLKQAATGKPYSDSNPYKIPMSKKKFAILALIEVGVGWLFGKGYASRLRASMNTAIKRTEATEYIDKSSFTITGSSDMFLYSNVTRTPIPTETRSGGGSGSSVHTSSGGNLHSGGGGHF